MRLQRIKRKRFESAGWKEQVRNAPLLSEEEDDDGEGLEEVKKEASGGITGVTRSEDALTFPSTKDRNHLLKSFTDIVKRENIY